MYHEYYWVYAANKFMNIKELEAFYLKQKEEFEGMGIKFGYEVQIAVYEMMPKAKRPQFKFNGLYSHKGIDRV